MEADRTILNRPDASFVDINKAEICGDGGREPQCLTGANVISHAFQALEKLGPKQAQQANQSDNAEGDQTRNKFERL